MRVILGIILSVFVLYSCDRIESDLTVDNLNDKEEYTSGMLVDCSSLNGERIKRVRLNNVEQTSIESVNLRLPGYYRLELYPDKRGLQNPSVIRVVVLDPERGETEWGLDKWIPKGIIVNSLGQENIQLIHSRAIPVGFSFPLVVVAGDYLTSSLINLQASVSSQDFLIKRGVGSAWASSPSMEVQHLVIDNRSFPIQSTEMDVTPLEIGGILEESLSIPEGSFVKIETDLHIGEGITLIIGAGSFISIDEGINIHNSGTFLFNGTSEQVVTVTCSDEASFWGGIISSGSTNSIEASHTIFCRSGFHSGEGYDYGHAKRQALFYSDKGLHKFTSCYMLDHAGQVFYPRGSRLEIKYCLIQRAITGGQANYSDVIIDHSVFTDFPDDKRIFQDKDNDAFYLSASNANISSSIFMYAVDDGLDSGGSQGGEVRVSNTRFESIFHEGAALSSRESVVKNHYFTSCLFIDCGQGLELGFSSPNHHVFVDSCSFVENGIGIRYGDNYSTQHEGFIAVSNSEIIESHAYDVWNMLREKWEADTAKMEFSNVKASSPSLLYPELIPYE